MRRITRLVLTIAAAVLVGATIPAAVIAIDPPPEEPLARMTALMDGMDRSMEAIRDDMRGMPNMGAMHGRMDRAMGMAEASVPAQDRRSLIETTKEETTS